MRYFAAFALMIAAGMATAAAHAQGQDFSKVEIKTTDLGHNTYMLQGAGGNITIAVGTDGVIMVDSQFAPLHDRLKAAIAAVTDRPVKFLIDTHYHGDHTGGNAAFAEEGAVIVAQENVKERLLHPSPGANGQTPPPAPPEALPTRVFTDKTAVSAGGRTAQIVHIANAHTDGDSYVLFADANVLATGDLGDNLLGYPQIDVRGGGGIDGMIAGADAFLKISNGQTKIVPGHGPLASKADLQGYRDMLVTARDRVAKAKAMGLTEDQAVQAKPLADMQAQRPASDMVSERFVRSVYESVK